VRGLIYWTLQVSSNALSKPFLSTKSPRITFINRDVASARQKFLSEVAQSYWKVDTMKVKLLSMAALMCVILAAPAANAQGFFGGRNYAPVRYNHGYGYGRPGMFSGFGGYGGGYGSSCGWHHHRHHRRGW
jgi:hypothetical protein